MSNNSGTLAVKYRPTKIEDYVGQPSAVAAYRGIMSRKTPSSAILITGDTGVGKTTLAMILAAALTGGPADSMTNHDLEEVDAGSERGIDRMRTAIENSKYTPTLGKRRVIVVDEVHALPQTSMNALLKALESPSARTTWILCTDQPERLPQRVHNRVERIGLGRPTPQAVMPLLVRVARTEKLRLGKEPKAVVVAIAKRSQGEPRMALSMLGAVANIIAGGGSPKAALEEAASSVSLGDTFDACIEFLKHALGGAERDAVCAVANVKSADGMIELMNKMLDGPIRLAAGAKPADGLGWVVSKRIGRHDLPKLLAFQTRLIAAHDIRSRYVVPSSALLFSLARRV